MPLPNALNQTPEGLLPPDLARACGSRERVAEVLFEQRRAENIAFCRTVTAVYALYRCVYADAEAEYLGLPADSTDRELLARRKDLRLRETELNAQVSTVLRVGPAAADNAVSNAVGFVERLPHVFALIGAGVIAPRAGQEALARSRVLTVLQAREFDGRLAGLLSDDPLALVALPALREAADRIVLTIDPYAAEKRRRRAIEDRTVTFRREDDGMASVYALVEAENGVELAGLLDEIADTVCAADPRTVAQRRGDGMMQLARGFTTLGCECGGPLCPLREARHAADGAVDGVLVRYRTLISVVVNERTLTDPENVEPGYLIGHGPITAQHARDLAARDDAVIRDFGQRIPGPDVTDAKEAEPSSGGADPAAGTEVPQTEPVDAESADIEPTAEVELEDDRSGELAPRSEPTESAPLAPAALVRANGATGYAPSADLSRYLTLLYPRCVFPLCTRPASRCQIDHSREYDHANPGAGGATTAGNLQPLCIAHHQLKTAGGWIDARLPDGRILWTAPDGHQYTVDPAGTVLNLFPDLARIDWTVPNTLTPDYRRPAPPTRIQREHERRQRFRKASIALLEDLGPRDTGTPQSVFEDKILVAITAHWQRRRAEQSAQDRAGPPQPGFPDVERHRRTHDEHEDDEPPPF